MKNELVTIKLGRKSPPSRGENGSFNNDSLVDDPGRIKFLEEMGTPFFDGDSVPEKYTSPNVHNTPREEMWRREDKIAVWKDCNKGLIIPKDLFNIIFCELYDCAPLISRIRGDQDYISFLHTWAIQGNREVIDKQVKHWMGTISQKGDVLETIFAPRKGTSGDTLYQEALKFITSTSKRTILLERNLNEIRGIATGEGVYFQACGYHLWTD